MNSQSRHLKMLGPVDSAFWYLDTDQTPMNIGSILVFEGKIDYHQLVQLADQRIHQIPLYRQKVIQAPGNLTEPTWAFDPNFYIEDHIHNHTLPPGQAGRADLQRLAGRLISRKLRRDRPLWELHLINGLEENQCALLFKIHHSMVDGISAIDLFSALFDASPQANDDAVTQPYHPPPVPSFMQLFNWNAEQAIPHRFKLMQKMGMDFFQMATGWIDREQRKNSLLGVVSALHDNLTPMKPLKIVGKNSGRLAVAWVDFDLNTILQIRNQERVTVNDVMLAILGIGIGRYLQARDEDSEQDFARVIIPVDMRKTDDEPVDDVGNRISMLPIELPLYPSNALEALHSVSRYTRMMKESDVAKTFDFGFSLPALTPAVMQPIIWHVVPKVFSLLAHLWCTNVRGPGVPLFLLGQQMTKAYGYLPINPSMGMAVTILSYNGNITLNVLADTAIIEDVNALLAEMDAAFYDLCDAIGLDAVPPGTDDSEQPDPAESTTQPTDEPVQPTTEATKPEDTPADVSPQPEPAIQTPTSAHNGLATHAVTQPATQPTTHQLADAIASPTQPEPLRIMSQAWADALHNAINESDAYHKASQRWTHGALAFIMQAEPKAGYDQPQAVLLDLYRGKCRRAINLPPQDAQRQASFVLDGSHQLWMDILERRAKALPMILSGKIKLSKGSLTKLIPFTKSSQELVACAIRVTSSE